MKTTFYRSIIKLVIKTFFLTNIFFSISGCLEPSPKQKYQGLTPYKINDAWGYKDINGKLVIDCNYQFADSFFEGLALIKNRKFFGTSTAYINETGERVTPWFDEGSRVCEGLIIVRKNGKYIYINKQGAKIIDDKFNVAYYFNNGFALVKKAGNFYFINKKGTKISKEYDKAYDFSSGFALVEKNGKYNIIDTNGRELCSWFRFADNSNQEKFFNYWSWDSYVINPQINASSSFFENGVAIVEIASFKNEWKTQPEDKPYVIINSSGKILSDNYDAIEKFSPQVFMAKIQDQSNGFLNFSYYFLQQNNNYKPSEKYTRIESLTENKLAVVAKKIGNEKTEKFGYVNEQGSLVIDCIYYQAERFKNGFAKVKKGNFSNYQSTLIDTTGKMLFDWVDEVEDIDNNIARLKLKNKTAFLNIISKKTSSWFDFVTNCNIGYKNYLVEKNQHYFYTDSVGNQISEIFDKVNDYKTHQETKRALLFFKYQQTVVDIDTRGQFFSSFAKVCKNNKWGYVDQTFKLAIPCKFDDAQEFNWETAIVTQNQNDYKINKKGEIVK